MSRASIARLFNQQVTVTRGALSPTGSGGTTTTSSTVASVRGAWRPASAREVESGNRVDLAFDHVAYLPHDTEVARGDRIAVAGVTGSYRVVSVKNPGGRGHHLEVLVAMEQG